MADPGADPVAIHNWYRLDERVTTSGQPTEAQLAALCDIGVGHIINLAPHNNARALPDEAASVAKLRMQYINIPVDFQNPAEADFAAFCDAMARLKGETIHVHCAANYRVSAFTYRYRREVLGLPDAEIRADMEQIWQPDPVWAAFIGL